MSSDEKIVLTYLDIRGLAEPVRLALTIGGLSFEDRRVTYEDVAKLRASGELPFGQVPIIQHLGRTFAQSGALLRWAGNKAGLYPLEFQPEIDMFLECLGDMKRALAPQWYGNALARSPVDGQLFPGTDLSGDQRASVASALNSTVMPTRCMQLEALAGKGGGPFVCGKTMTIADLELYVMVEGIEDGTYCEGLSKSLLRECQNLRNAAGLVASHEKVAAWNAKQAARGGRDLPVTAQ